MPVHLFVFSVGQPLPTLSSDPSLLLSAVLLILLLLLFCASLGVWFLLWSFVSQFLSVTIDSLANTFSKVSQRARSVARQCYIDEP